MFALFEDASFDYCETAGSVRFAHFTSGYGYSPPSATLASDLAMGKLSDYNKWKCSMMYNQDFVKKPLVLVGNRVKRMKNGGCINVNVLHIYAKREL